MIDQFSFTSYISHMQPLKPSFRTLLLIFGVLAGHGVRAGEELPPKIWLNHFRLGSLATAADNEWPVMSEGTDTAFFALNTLWPLRMLMPLSIPPEISAGAAAKLHDKGIRIGVECGYFDHATIIAEPGNPASDVLFSPELPALVAGVGEATARVEIAKLRPLWRSGHPPDFLILDDPMRRLTVPGQDVPGQLLQGLPDYPAAAREVVGYMKVMREKFPAVKFVIIVNFPNWGWKGGPAFLVAPGLPSPMNWGDAHLALETLFGVVKQAGQEIHAIQADFPWRYFERQPPSAIAATVDWPGRLLQLEQYARDKGVRFHLTTNSETGYVSSQAFAEDSLKYLDAYLAAGGRPDHFVVQSWYPHPDQLLPESEPYTGAWLAARFIERLREIHSGSPVAAALLKTEPFDRSEPEALLHLLQRIDPERWNELAPQVLGTWLNLPQDPPVTLAAGLLQALREASARAMSGKPRATVILGRSDVLPARGLAPLRLHAGLPQVCIFEIINGAAESKLVTAWVEGAAAQPMPAVWVSPSGSKLFAVNVDPAKAANGSFKLCVGTPGGEVREVAIPVKISP
jgi:hypothetical protein